MKKIVSIIAAALILISCGDGQKNGAERVSVSIVPLKYFVDRISGGDFEVDVMVPPGASPETFEPTITQMKKLNDSKVFFTLGLMDFERAYIPTIQESMPEVQICNLSHVAEAEHGTHQHHENCSCTSHGVDPHIWLSVENARIIAKNIAEQLSILKPDSSAKYESNLAYLSSQIDSLDTYIIENLKPGRFLIYHPSLGYFSEQYGLTQIAIENDGKEPSAAYMKTLMDSLKGENIGIVLYQEQLSKSAVESIAKELKINMKPFDPLAYDWLENMKQIVALIKQSTDGQQ